MTGIIIPFPRPWAPTCRGLGAWRHVHAADRRMARARAWLNHVEFKGANPVPAIAPRVCIIDRRTGKVLAHPFGILPEVLLLLGMRERTGALFAGLPQDAPGQRAGLE